jgi:hypothetical protein
MMGSFQLYLLPPAGDEYEGDGGDGHQEHSAEVQLGAWTYSVRRLHCRSRHGELVARMEPEDREGKASNEG